MVPQDLANTRRFDADVVFTGRRVLQSSGGTDALLPQAQQQLHEELFGLGGELPRLPATVDRLRFGTAEAGREGFIVVGHCLLMGTPFERFFSCGTMSTNFWCLTSLSITSLLFVANPKSAPSQSRYAWSQRVSKQERNLGQNGYEYEFARRVCDLGATKKFRPAAPAQHLLRYSRWAIEMVAGARPEPRWRSALLLELLRAAVAQCHLKWLLLPAHEALKGRRLTPNRNGCSCPPRCHLRLGVLTYMKPLSYASGKQCCFFLFKKLETRRETLPTVYV